MTATLRLLFLLVANLLIVGQIASLEASTESNDICSSIANRNSTTFRDILCVGALPERLLLITNDFQVYDLPIKSLQSSIDKLYLNTERPTSLQQKWPALYSSEYFQRCKDKIANAFIVAKDEQALLFIITLQAQTSVFGVTYDLVTNEAEVGGQLNRTDTVTVMLSTIDQDIFYGLKLFQEGILIASWKFNTVSLHSGMTQDSDYFQICQGQSPDEIFINMEAKPDCIPVTWPVVRGFVAENKFHLFSAKQVIIFDGSIWTSDSHTAQVKLLNYDQFIMCSGRADTVDNQGSTIAGILIAVLLLVLVICLCLCVYIRKSQDESANMNNKKKNKAETKSQEGQKSQGKSRERRGSSLAKLASRGRFGSRTRTGSGTRLLSKKRGGGSRSRSNKNGRGVSSARTDRSATVRPHGLSSARTARSARASQGAAGVSKARTDRTQITRAN